MSQITLLGQVLQLLPRDPFKKLIKHYQTDKRNKGISSWDHMVSMIFCHIVGADSVRDISNGLRSITGDRVHLGMEAVPSKSSVSWPSSITEQPMHMQSLSTLKSNSLGLTSEVLKKPFSSCLDSLKSSPKSTNSP